jgi:hypothetical protein
MLSQKSLFFKGVAHAAPPLVTLMSYDVPVTKSAPPARARKSRCGPVHLQRQLVRCERFIPLPGRDRWAAPCAACAEPVPPQRPRLSATASSAASYLSGHGHRSRSATHRTVTMGRTWTWGNLDAVMLTGMSSKLPHSQATWPHQRYGQCMHQCAPG